MYYLKGYKTYVYNVTVFVYSMIWTHYVTNCRRSDIWFYQCWYVWRFRVQKEIWWVSREIQHVLILSFYTICCISSLAIVYIYLVTKYMILRVCYSREIISYISLHRHYSRTCEALTFNHVYDQNILGMSNSAEITCL